MNILSDLLELHDIGGKVFRESKRKEEGKGVSGNLFSIFTHTNKLSIFEIDAKVDIFLENIFQIFRF